jgi:hypothetical protein
MFLFVRPGLRYVSLACIVFSVLGDIGPSPGYQTPLLLLVLLLSHFEKTFLACLSALLVPLSLILDVIWCIVWGVDDHGVVVFSLVMTIIILFLKLPLIYFVLGMYYETKASLRALIDTSVPQKDTDSASTAQDQQYLPPTNSIKEPLSPAGHSSEANSDKV